MKIQNVSLLKSMLNDNSHFIEEALIKIAINVLENIGGHVHFVHSKISNSILLTMFTNQNVNTY